MTLRAGKNQIFSEFCWHLKLMAKLCKYATRGFCHDRVQSATRKNTTIRIHHAIVIRRKVSLRNVEAVEILHGKLTTPQKTGLRARFVAKLVLNLIHRNRQILVRLHVRLDKRGHHFLVRGAKRKLLAARPLQFEKNVHRVPAPSYFPGSLWDKCGHENLLPANRIHLLSNNLLNLV
jgi:hypothetical protein